jgi:hypothetical protein
MIGCNGRFDEPHRRERTYSSANWSATLSTAADQMITACPIHFTPDASRAPVSPSRADKKFAFSNHGAELRLLIRVDDQIERVRLSFGISNGYAGSAFGEAYGTAQSTFNASPNNGCCLERQFTRLLPFLMNRAPKSHPVYIHKLKIIN